MYDFVPLQPRAPATLATLLTGGAVDGEIRVLPAREPTSSPAADADADADEWRVVGHTALSAEAVESLVRGTEANPTPTPHPHPRPRPHPRPHPHQVRERAAQPESGRLSLLTNNCFSFAASVLAAAAVDPNPNPDTKGSPYS